MTALIQSATSQKLKAVLRFTSALWAVLVFSAIASASSPATPAFPETPRSHGLLTNPWAITDLDGDHFPDLVSSTGAGSDASGYRYRIELQLSGGRQTTPFTITTGNHLGLNIVPRDVDGDRDLDLVVTSGALHQPVGVWINDGQGGFARADSSLYPIRNGMEEISLLQLPTDQSTLFSSDGGQRISFALPQTTLRWRLDNASSRWASSAVVSLSFNHTGKKQSRAPPISLHS